MTRDDSPSRTGASSASAARTDAAGSSATPEEDSSGWLSVLRTGALIAVALLFVWLAFNVRLPELEELRAMIESYGWASRLVFVGLYALVAITPIPVTIMSLAGGVLFGVVEGVLLSVIGSTVGAAAAYWLARALGRQTVMRMLGRHGRTLERHIGSAGFLAVLTLRVMPGLPYWPLNYGAGALGVRFGTFLPAATLGAVPGQFSLVSIGAFAARPSWVIGAVVAVSWLVVILMTLAAGRRWRRAARQDRPAQDDDGTGPDEAAAPSRS